MWLVGVVGWLGGGVVGGCTSAEGGMGEGGMGVEGFVL